MVMSLVFLLIVSPLIILVVISSSFIPLINCSFNSLSWFLYLLVVVTNMLLFFNSASTPEHFHFPLCSAYNTIVIK